MTVTPPMVTTDALADRNCLVPSKIEQLVLTPEVAESLDDGGEWLSDRSALWFGSEALPRRPAGKVWKFGETGAT